MFDRLVRAGSVASIVFLLAGCAPASLVSQTPPAVQQLPVPQPAPPRPGGGVYPMPDVRQLRAAACASWRWIGVKERPAAACPQPTEPGWRVRQLFSSPRQERAVTAAQPGQPGMDAFCLYERDREARDSDLGRLKGLKAAEKDCTALAISAAPETGVEVASWLAWQQHFFAQVGRVELPASTAPPVRLAILDTAATRTESASDHPAQHPGNSPHGYTLVNMARHLVDNAAQIHTQLALPIVAFDPRNPAASKRDEVNGGFVGLLGDLAAAIYGAVEDWRQTGGQSRLVINLSLGWEGAFFGGLESTPEQMPAGVQAVYRSLQYASLHGALVVAASGNLLGLPSKDQGALLPAAWEARPAPGRKECEQLLGKQRLCSQLGKDRSDLRRPLLYAAGGVRAGGAPLANVRAKSLPRLLTFADHAVVTDLTGAPTATLTGSSVAALVVSSAAAAVWHYRPKASAAEVMELVYAAGDDLGHPADLFFAAPAPSCRRVTLCTAVSAACKGGACTPPGCDAKGFGALPAVAMAGATVVSASGVNQSFPTPSPPCAAGFELLFEPGKAPVHPCPFQQLISVAAESWTSPQPGSNPCPNCTMFPDPLGQNAVPDGSRSLSSPASSYSLRIRIDDGFAGTLTDPILQVENSKPLALPLAPLNAGDEVEVKGLPVPPLGAAVHLTFAVNNNRSAFSPVLVVEAP